MAGVMKIETLVGHIARCQCIDVCITRGYSFQCKHAMKFITIKSTDCLYFTIRWMPESARWLIANGKLEQAQMYLKKCAKMNQAEKVVDKLKTEVSLYSR